MKFYFNTIHVMNGVSFDLKWDLSKTAITKYYVHCTQLYDTTVQSAYYWALFS